MFDTVAISKTFARAPDFDLLVRNGGQPLYGKHSGEIYKLFLNGERNAGEPRLTISQNPRKHWILRAEVSIGVWMFDSNLFLPNENDLQNFFVMISEFVGDKTGVRFDAQIERVTRVDVTNDFTVDESIIFKAIAALNKVNVAKYDRQQFNDASIYFVNKGKVKNKKIAVYSKHHELLNKNVSPGELDLAKNIIRLEIQHKNNQAVADLANSLKLPNHNANHILTRRVSEAVIEKTANIFNFKSLLEKGNGQLENLFDKFDQMTAYKLAGHLALKHQYGAEYGRLPFVPTSPRTVKDYEKRCKQAGVLSLE